MKLKSVLLLSLALNIVLVAVGASMWGRRPVSPTSAAERKLPVVVATQANPEVIPAADPSPASPQFSWQQLEPENDVAYIRHLREVGCPEATIKDILAAAIGHRYDEKRRALQEKKSKGELDAAGLEEAIAQSWDEQNRLLAKLFGGPESFGADGTVAKSAPSGVAGHTGGLAERWGHRESVPRPRATAPLVFLEPDPSWGLSDVQLTFWNQVREKFATAIGGGTQNPKDPAYLQRWRDAAAEADSTLKAYFGASKISDWQMQTLSRMPPPPAR